MTEENISQKLSEIREAVKKSPEKKEEQYEEFKKLLVFSSLSTDWMKHKFYEEFLSAELWTERAKFIEEFIRFRSKHSFKDEIAEAKQIQDETKTISNEISKYSSVKNELKNFKMFEWFNWENKLNEANLENAQWIQTELIKYLKLSSECRQFYWEKANAIKNEVFTLKWFKDKLSSNEDLDTIYNNASNWVSYKTKSFFTNIFKNLWSDYIPEEVKELNTLAESIKKTREELNSTIKDQAISINNLSDKINWWLRTSIDTINVSGWDKKIRDASLRLQKDINSQMDWGKSKLKSNLDEVEKKIKNIWNLLNKNEKYSSEATEAIKKLEELLKTIKKHIEEKENEKRKLEEERNKLIKWKNDVISKRSVTEKNISYIEQKLQEVWDWNNEQKQELLKELDKNKNNKAILNNDIDSLEKGITEVDKKIDIYEQDILKIKNDEKNYLSDLKELKTTKENLEKSIKDLEKAKETYFNQKKEISSAINEFDINCIKTKEICDSFVSMVNQKLNENITANKNVLENFSKISDATNQLLYWDSELTQEGKLENFTKTIELCISRIEITTEANTTNIAIAKIRDFPIKKIKKPSEIKKESLNIPDSKINDTMASVSKIEKLAKQIEELVEKIQSILTKINNYINDNPYLINITNQWIWDKKQSFSSTSSTTWAKTVTQLVNSILANLWNLKIWAILPIDWFKWLTITKKSETEIFVWNWESNHFLETKKLKWYLEAYKIIEEICPSLKNNIVEIIEKNNSKLANNDPNNSNFISIDNGFNFNSRQFLKTLANVLDLKWFYSNQINSESMKNQLVSLIKNNNSSKNIKIESDKILKKLGILENNWNIDEWKLKNSI